MSSLIERVFLADMVAVQYRSSIVKHLPDIFGGLIDLHASLITYTTGSPSRSQSYLLSGSALHGVLIEVCGGGSAH